MGVNSLVNYNTFVEDVAKKLEEVGVMGLLGDAMCKIKKKKFELL